MTGASAKLCGSHPPTVARKAEEVSMAKAKRQRRSSIRTMQADDALQALDDLDRLERVERERQGVASTPGGEGGPAEEGSRTSAAGERADE